MVQAIDFAVRTSAGKVVHGAVSGEGGGEFLQVGSGESVSLNLSQSSVLGYERQGKDLIVKLSDGRQITLSGYFESNPGEDNKLYLSSNGDVNEVFLTDGGNGVMYANYGPVDTWNKYSNVDDIRFANDNTLMAVEGYGDDPAGMGMFVPGLLGGMGGSGLGIAAGLGGLGILGGLAGGGGDDTGGGNLPAGRIPPTVNNADGSKDITTNTEDQSVIVSGTGEPGEKVVVDVGGKTESTTIDENGNWETEFKGDNHPGDGTHEAVVVVTPKDGPSEKLDGPDFIIDLTPPAVSMNDDGVENLEEYADGVTVTGEGEAGAKIVVTVPGGSQNTTVGADGKWEVTFTQTQIPGGDYKEIPVTITATDPMGNTNSITDKIAIDTVPHPLTFNPVTSDNVINTSESSGVIQVTGVSTPGAMVEVKLQGSTITQTVQTDASGIWTATYPAGTFAGGDGERTFTATTSDAAGNISSSSHKVMVDTTATVGFTPGNLVSDTNNDGTINATEAQNGVTMTGHAEVGSKSVTVEWNGHTQTTTAINADGTWSVTFPQSQVPIQSGNAGITSTARVTAVDAYDNTSAAATRTVTVDRETSVSIDDNQAGGDNIITAKEADKGVTLTGKAEAGASVEVTFQGETNTVTADSSGSWQSTFTSAQISGGTFMADNDDTRVSVVATDKAGNMKVGESKFVHVDTEVPLTAGTDSYNSIKADQILNEAEAQQGLTVTGTVEAGSVVMVKLGDGAAVQATVTGENWTYTFTGNQIPGANDVNGDGGAISADLVVTATDKLGNVSAPYTETIDIDRLVTPFTRDGDSIGSDRILNAAEVANGLDLNGTGEVGAQVKVILSNSQSETVTVGTNGKWSARFEADQLPTSANDKMRITFEATDEAGNVKSFHEHITVDTVAPDSPNVTAFSKNVAGTDLTGIKLDETITSDFSFHRVGANGSATEIQLESGSVGSKWADFDSTTVPEGDYLVVNHVDTAGNGSATMFLTNNTGTSTIDLDNAAFKDFDFTSLDLSMAQTNMTISAEDLIAITGPENTLVIKGGTDDHITLQGGALASDQGDAPAGFKLYTLGDNASVYIDEDIHATF